MLGITTEKMKEAYLSSWHLLSGVSAKSQHSSSVLKGPAQIRTYLGLERQHHAVWETYGEAQLTLMCGENVTSVGADRQLLKLNLSAASSRFRQL